MPDLALEEARLVAEVVVGAGLSLGGGLQGGVEGRVHPAPRQDHARSTRGRTIERALKIERSLGKN